MSSSLSSLEEMTLRRYGSDTEPTLSSCRSALLTMEAALASFFFFFKYLSVDWALMRKRLYLSGNGGAHLWAVCRCLLSFLKHCYGHMYFEKVAKTKQACFMILNYTAVSRSDQKDSYCAIVVFVFSQQVQSVCSIWTKSTCFMRLKYVCLCTCSL